MDAPEVKAVVEQWVAHLRRQLEAAEEHLRSLEDEQVPPDAPKRRSRRKRAVMHAVSEMTHREFLRDIITNAEATDGLAPAEMRAIAAEAGRTFPASFPYAQLKKLKGDKEVRS